MNVIRPAVTVAALAALATAGVAERGALHTSFALLGHPEWIWIPVLIASESVSMAAFALMFRRLLAAGGSAVGVRPMLATTYAANALSVSVPLAGPGLATAFTFRRFTRQGADAPLAGWSLLAGGVADSAGDSKSPGRGCSGRDRGCAAGLPAIRGPRSGPGRSGWGRCACPPRGGWR
jgi:uncharacterized membrane protein YbhN (UPF0104 family)